jgi:hypothetical protein
MSNKPFLFTPGSMDKLQHTDVAHSVEVDEERSSRIKAKYQKLVENGLYENHDLRSFSNTLWFSIVHFDDKTIYVFTYPMVSATPAAYIKTCTCGSVVFKELDRDIHERVVDLEDVLDAIALPDYAQFCLRDQHNTDFDGDPDVPNPHAQIPFNHPYLKQTKEAD